MRIVSLLASGTEIVCALGAGDSLVGRSHECDNPALVRSLPRCSEPAFDVSVSSREIDREVNRRVRSGEPLYTIDHDLIARLAPDVIIAQQHCEVCAVTPGNLNPGIRAKVVSLSAYSVEEILASIGMIADALGNAETGLKPRLQAEACSTIRSLRERAEQVRQQTHGRPRPSVALLEWTDPIFAMGNWGPELIEMAGGEPVLGTQGEHSRAIRAERLRDADPDFLIVAPCGFNLERSDAEQAVLEELPWWDDLRCVREGRVVFADGNLYFNRSGITVVRTAEILAEILHEIVSEYPSEGTCWRWYTKRRVRV
jgi:iron complex transport system substrate-binding protein